MFPRLDYLEWMEGRPEVALHDLGSSDLRGDRDHEPEVVPAPLRDLPDPPTGASLETQLAGEYGVHPEQVLVTPGASVANFVAAAAALHPDPAADGTGDGVGGADDESGPPTVLVEKPGYEPLVEGPAAVGGSVNRFLREDDYRLDPGRVEGALTEATRLVTVTNRHNPSGRLTDPDALADVAAAARDVDARLLVDEVYAPFGPAAEDGPFGGPTAVDLDGAVVTGSLTKFFGLGDVRVGWLVAGREFVERARSILYHVPGNAGPSRALGMRALHNAAELGERARDLAAANADLLADFVDARDDVDGVVPAGSTFAFLDPANADGDELAAAAWDAGVLVVPGRFFEDASRVRLSLGRTPEQSRAALDALGAVLDEFR